VRKKKRGEGVWRCLDPPQWEKGRKNQSYSGPWGQGGEKVRTKRKRGRVFFSAKRGTPPNPGRDKEVGKRPPELKYIKEKVPVNPEKEKRGGKKARADLPWRGGKKERGGRPPGFSITYTKGKEEGGEARRPGFEASKLEGGAHMLGRVFRRLRKKKG